MYPQLLEEPAQGLPVHAPHAGPQGLPKATGTKDRLAFLFFHSHSNMSPHGCPTHVLARVPNSCPQASAVLTASQSHV